MKKKYTILFSFLCLAFLCLTFSDAQVNLYTQDFEGADEDNYILTNASDANINFGILGNGGADYILRANPSTISFIDVQPTGFGGSNVMVWEDTDDYVGEFYILSNSFDITGAQDISVSLKVGATNDGNNRYEPSNFIIIEYDLDGAPDNWIKIGEFRGVNENPASMFNFFEDDNLDGSFTVRTTNVMRTVNYNLNNRAGTAISGNTMRIRIRTFSGSQEEMVIDDLIVSASSVLSTNEKTIENALSIYPNPSNGNITVKNTGIALDTIEIIDLNGRTIAQRNLDGTTSDKELDLSTVLSSGIYLARISSETAFTIKK